MDLAGLTLNGYYQTISVGMILRPLKTAAGKVSIKVACQTI
jgi:hypothetical protein